MTRPDVKPEFAILKDAFPDAIGEVTPQRERDAAAMFDGLRKAAEDPEWDAYVKAQYARFPRFGREELWEEHPP
jgi:hypothetical protein